MDLKSTYISKPSIVVWTWVSNKTLWYVNTNTPLNTLKPTQNGRHFEDDNFKCIFLDENMFISIEIALKFAPTSQINNIP